MWADDQELRERARRLETRLEEIEAFADPECRAKSVAAIQALLVFYGDGLERIVEIIVLRDPGLLDLLVEDEMVSHLLLLHGLHPLDLDTRLAKALDQVRPYLQSHGGDVELLGVEEGIARLRLQGSCSGCPSSTMTLKLAVEDAIRTFAPELDGIEAVNAAQPVGQSGYVPLASIQRNGGGPAENGASWQVINDLLPFENGRKRAMDVAGLPVLFLKLENTLYAYRNSCPGCGLALDRGVLAGTGLACPACGHAYDIRRAGRCLDAPALHLEPVPLLVEAEIVKIALPAAVH
jgi:Fe-S cluster biogenesis protein NfuA/nitrite reductase/ring-hydroxylating ferredoxin subunit